MAESYLENGNESSSSADRYQVMVHVSAETLDSDVSAETSETETAHIEEGPHVSAETSRRICCDTSIGRLVEDKNGEPLSIGRKSRVIPPPMRRALKARDKNCRFPGCTHQHFIDGHHIKHWSDGGDTSLNNLVQLCRFHHRLVHEGGFGCDKDQDGRVVFSNEIGMPINESDHKLPPIKDNVVVYLKEKLEDRHIHSQTCVTKWDGEKIDRNLAVGNLWHLTQSSN